MAKKNDNTGHSFLAYFKRATSPLVVLRLLLEKPMYGYELTQEMKRRSGGNFTIYLKSNQYLTNPDTLTVFPELFLIPNL